MSSSIQSSLKAHVAQQAKAGQPVPTAISFVVDRSGSMSGYQAQVQNSVTKLIKNQQDERGSAIFTLAQFDDQYEVVFKDKEITKVDPSQFHYQPRGGTSLRDAVVQSVKDMEAYLKGVTGKDQPKPKKIVIAYITDGEDTSSSFENTVEKVRKLIEEKVKGGWIIFLLGADRNTLEFGKELGIPEDTTAIYSVDNPDAAIDLLNEKIGQARRGRTVMINQQERLALSSGKEKKDL